MQILLILCHPKPGSLTHAAADRIIGALNDEGHTVYHHDLYKEHFQPVLENEEIARRFSFDDVFTMHARELREASGVVFIYPDWWGMPPAMLKGWIDRLLRPGVAFDFEGAEFMPKEKVPLLGGRRALVINTTDETNPLSQEAMYALWRERVFGYVGITDVSFKTFYNVRESTGRQRRQWLQELDDLARRFV
ncbi:MAG: NAD(P)H-dependent oxidoreductase [Alkalispirochaeta sp.]